jgi:hypothetical protein
MAVTRERFAQGMTYDEFKSSMTRNRERFDEELPRTIDVLVLAEDWCGDVIDNLPILGRIAAETGKLNLRIFPRDQHLDIMDQYLKEGQFRSIPVFVFFDENFVEVGRFIERPDSVTERRAQLRREAFAQHPEWGSPETPIAQLPEDVRTKYMEATASGREQSKDADNKDVVQALRDIVTRVRA